MTNIAMPIKPFLTDVEMPSTDNTEVLAWALENKGFEVGITSLGNPDTIAPAVQKGKPRTARLHQ